MSNIFIFRKRFYLPIIILGISGLLGLALMEIQNKYLFYTCIFLPGIIFILTLIFSIYNIFKFGIRYLGQTIIICKIAFVGIGILNNLLIYYPYDFFADNLSIPKNIQISDPIDRLNNGELPIIREKNKFEDLILINGNQGGIYEYQFYTRSSLDSGFIYLKAFEITTNINLSARSLIFTTKLEIPNSNYTKIHSEQTFTIYEGDWGKYYGARFEVWYYNKRDSTEKKIFEKNYKIQGWQR